MLLILLKIKYEYMGKEEREYKTTTKKLLNNC